MPLLFPPFRAGQGRDAALDSAGKRQGGAAHFVEIPARLDAHIDVHPAGAAGLRPTAKPDIGQQGADFERHLAHIRPFHTRAGIEVDA